MQRAKSLFLKDVFPQVACALNFWSMPPWHDTQGAMFLRGAPTRTSTVREIGIDTPRLGLALAEKADAVVCPWPFRRIQPTQEAQRFQHLIELPQQRLRAT